MNISYRWLQALLPGLDAAPDRIADVLAMQGAPVDEIVDLGGPLRDVRVARVIEARRHPNADRLSLCRVDAGDGTELQVVCGAPNVKSGGIYPFAPVGATLPGDLVIRRAKIRGEESEGMLCSARELGLGRDHEGILELPDDLPVGASFIDVMALDDVRLVVDVTPNRPDLLSHLGVAREVGAALGIAAGLPRLPNTPVASAELARGNPARGDGVTVQLEDTGLCPRYLGLVVRGVSVAPAPPWLAGRVRAIGLRPISNVVDATNYVLHELGQPLHAFDLARLGDTVVVREARAGERITTLDGVERELDAGMLVIADRTRPVALAGVMGGADTEVHDGTRDVLLECAIFDGRRVRRTRRALDLATDASYRFERGIDSDQLERALWRTAELIVATAGGAIAPVAADAGPGLPAVPAVTLRLARVAQVLGIDFDVERIATLLEPLGYTVSGRAESHVVVSVPAHRRHDVAREEDLIEDIARRHGYDSFPQELRAFRPSAVPDDAHLQLEDALRTQLVGAGLLEARTPAFAAESEGDVALLLPLSAAEGRLRRALVPGLLRRLELNFSRAQRHVRLFEIGTAFELPAGSAPPVESRRLALVLTGARRPPHWSGAVAPFDVWDLKALLGQLAGRLQLQVKPATPAVDWLEPDSGFRLLDGTGIVRGWGGRVRSAAVDAPAWADPVWAAEVVLEATAPERPRFRALPAYPPIERDLALLVPEAIPAADVEQTIRSAAGPLLEATEPFDLYRGTGVPAGTRSLALRLRFRATDRTLTDADADAAVARVLKRLKESHDIDRRG
ncbi:MAG TPA: phenylalanine--tRNA ligase subunit beta [Longimicrobiales bacterium]|nr:phenylalanine--tRNA ligase subunit beta [Longimicrobiales bacterium]